MRWRNVEDGAAPTIDFSWRIPQRALVRDNGFVFDVCASAKSPATGVLPDAVADSAVRYDTIEKRFELRKR